MSRGLRGITRCRRCGREGVLGFSPMFVGGLVVGFACKNRRACAARQKTEGIAEAWKAGAAPPKEE